MFKKKSKENENGTSGNSSPYDSKIHTSQEEQLYNWLPREQNIIARLSQNSFTLPRHRSCPTHTLAHTSPLLTRHAPLTAEPKWHHFLLVKLTWAWSVMSLQALESGGRRKKKKKKKSNNNDNNYTFTRNEQSLRAAIHNSWAWELSDS